MKRVCAWCGSDLGDVNPEYVYKHPITHGICDRCGHRLLSQVSQPMQEFLDSLNVPVMMLESSPHMFTANARAREILAKQRMDVQGYHGSEVVVECMDSLKPEGCGKDTHCKSCTIRRCVRETHATGKSFVGVPAYPDHELEEEDKNLIVAVTTEKVGETVLLRIDEHPHLMTEALAEIGEYREL